MINEATKINLSVAVFGGVIWAFTGTWQFFAVAAGGALCTWMFTSPPDRPQPRPRRRVREFVRVEIRDIETVAACYDYGGCKWAGDGCAGKPVVLGPGEGCVHTGKSRHGVVVRSSSTGKRCPDHKNRARACDVACWEHWASLRLRGQER
jgi:hypothetical protein